MQIERYQKLFSKIAEYSASRKYFYRDEVGAAGAIELSKLS